MSRERVAWSARSDAFAMTCVVLLLSAGLAHGQDQSGTVSERGLSVGDAISRALDREPDLRSARTEIDAARGAAVQARLKPNPTLMATRQQEPSGMDNQTMVSVEWPLALFRTPARVAAAEQRLEATAERVADRERTIVAEVRAAYGAAAAAIRDLEVTGEIVTAARRQLDALRARVAEGAAAPIERDLLAVEERRIEADRLLLTARADTALLGLKRRMNMRPDEPLVLRDRLETLLDAPLPPDRDADGAVDGRSDVREAAANLLAADRGVDLARAEGRFDVSLVGTYTRMNAGFPQFGVTRTGGIEPIRGVFHYVAAGATVSVPLRNKNQGEIAAAQAARAGAEHRLEAVRLDARIEIAAATLLHQRARETIEAYASEILPLARRNLDVVRQTYELGRTSVAEMMTEQRRYLDVERAYTDALRQLYDARTELARALGARP